jgi:hypothetical protein
MWDSANSESAHAWPLHPIALLIGRGGRLARSITRSTLAFSKRMSGGHGCRSRSSGL